MRSNILRYKFVRVIAAICAQTFLCTAIASAQPTAASLKTPCLSPKIQLDASVLTLDFAKLAAGFSSRAVGLGIEKNELVDAAEIVRLAFSAEDEKYSAIAFGYRFPQGADLQKMAIDFYRRSGEENAAATSEIIRKTDFFAIKSTTAKSQPLIFSAQDGQHLLFGYAGTGGTAFYEHARPSQAYVPYGLAETLYAKITEQLKAARARRADETAMREIIRPAARLMKLFAVAAAENYLKKKDQSYRPHFSSAEAYEAELAAVLQEISQTYGINLQENWQSSGMLIPQKRARPSLRGINPEDKEVTGIQVHNDAFYAQVYEASYERFESKLLQQIAESYFQISMEQWKKTFESLVRYNRSQLALLKNGNWFGLPFLNGLSYWQLSAEFTQQTWDAALGGFKGLSYFISDMTNVLLKRFPSPEQRFSFGEGGDLANTPNEIVYESPILKLRRYMPANKQVKRKPVLLSYSWINKYEIFDLDPNHGKSMVKYLVDQGFEVYVTDWQEVTAENKSYAEHIDDYIEELLKSTLIIRQLTGEQKIDILGYCIGGTLMMILVSLYPQFFDRVIPMTAGMVSKVGGDETTLNDERQLANQVLYAISDRADPFQIVNDNNGIFPANNLRDTFGFIQPGAESNPHIGGLIQRWLQGIGPAEHPLLAWNERGQNPGRAHAEFLDLIYNKSLLAKGKLNILGRPVDLKNITQEMMILLAKNDHIVLPEAAKYTANLVASSNIQIWEIPSGHVGIATDKRAYAKVVEFLTKGRSEAKTRTATEKSKVQISALQKIGVLEKSPKVLINAAI